VKQNLPVLVVLVKMVELVLMVKTLELMSVIV
jgi:hypothetical protein